MAKLSGQRLHREETDRQHIDECLNFYYELLNTAGKKRGAPGSVQAILSMLPAPRLMKFISPMMENVSPLDDEELTLLKESSQIIGILEEKSFVRHPNLSRFPLASEYLYCTMYGLDVECFHMLCLDKHGRLKENVLLNRGVYDASIFSARLMLEEIARVKPDSIVLCHNHPGGTLIPSQDDLDITMEAIISLQKTNVVLLDHIISSINGVVSLRGNNFVPARHWIKQNSEHKLLCEWFSTDRMPDKHLNRSSPSLLLGGSPQKQTE